MTGMDTENIRVWLWILLVLLNILDGWLSRIITQIDPFEKWNEVIFVLSSISTLCDDYFPIVKSHLTVRVSFWHKVAKKHEEKKAVDLTLGTIVLYKLPSKYWASVSQGYSKDHSRTLYMYVNYFLFVLPPGIPGVFCKP